MSRSPELARWLADGPRLFAARLGALQNCDRLQAYSQALETENEILREEVARLRQELGVLQTERAGMVVTFNYLVGQVTQVIDHVPQKSSDGENS